jgi:hypothetical protein
VASPLRWTVILSFVAIALAARPVQSQEKSPNSESSSPVNATSATAANAPANHGKLHKLVGRYPSLPEPETQLERDPSSVHFWTYRGAHDAPLRGNREVFRSKLFLTTHVGGAIAMIVACRNQNSGYGWRSQVPAVGVIFGMDYLQFRFVGGPNAIGPPVYEMIRYGLSSTR